MNLNLLFKIWSKGEDNWNGEPRCEKQRLEEPAGSGEPLHTIFDEYADDQSAWMRDYVPAMEKMLANGHDSLVDAPDFTTGVRRLNLLHHLIFRLSARSPLERFGRQCGLATRTRPQALVLPLSLDLIVLGMDSRPRAELSKPEQTSQF